jgi:hypothetical protein
MTTQNLLMLISTHSLLLRLSTMAVIVATLYFVHRVLAVLSLEE